MTTAEMLALIRQRRDRLRAEADNSTLAAQNAAEADRYRISAQELDGLICEIEDTMSPKKTDTLIRLDPLRTIAPYHERLDTLEGKVDALFERVSEHGAVLFGDPKDE